MRTLEEASVMLITTAVVMMLVALPVGLSLSSSIISTNTVTTAQQPPLTISDFGNNITISEKPENGRWEIKKGDGSICSGKQGDADHTEFNIKIDTEKTKSLKIAIYVSYKWTKSDVYNFCSASFFINIPPQSGPSSGSFRVDVPPQSGTANDANDFDGGGYIGNEGLKESTTEDCTIVMTALSEVQIMCDTTGEMSMWIEVLPQEDPPEDDTIAKI